MARSEVASITESGARNAAPAPPDDPAREALQRAGVLDRLPELLQIARDLFPGEVSYAIETDPELPSEHYVVFDVFSAGGYAEISAREREWFQRTYDRLGDDCDKVRLFVGFKR